MRTAYDIRHDLSDRSTIAYCNTDMSRAKNKRLSLGKAGDELLTIKEAATSLRVHEKTLYRWIAEGRIRAVRINRMLRLPTQSLEAFCLKGTR